MQEGLCKGMAMLGCGLWLLSSLCPLFGNGAKVEALCHDDFECTWRVAGDSLPVLEMLAPIVALVLLVFFARMAFAFWAPVAERSGGAAQLVPVALLGGGWALWRALLYPVDPITLPYILFWIGFSGWFLASAWAVGGRRRMGGG